MKKLLTLVLALLLTIMACCPALADGAMTFKRGISFDMTFEKAFETAGEGAEKSDYPNKAGNEYFSFKDTVAGRDGKWVTVHSDGNGNVHSILYSMGYASQYSNVDTQAYRGTEVALQEKYGVPAYSDDTGRMLPFTSATIEDSFFKEYSVYTMTSINGEKYGTGFDSDMLYVVDCPKYSQWVVQDGDHYIVVEHSLVEWSSYQKSSSSLSANYILRANNYNEFVHYAYLSAEDYQTYIVGATNAANDGL